MRPPTVRLVRFRRAWRSLGAGTSAYVDGRAVEQIDLTRCARVVIQVRDSALVGTSLTQGDLQMTAADRSLKMHRSTTRPLLLSHGRMNRSAF